MDEQYKNIIEFIETVLGMEMNIRQKLVLYYYLNDKELAVLFKDSERKDKTEKLKKLYLKTLNRSDEY